MKRNFPQDEEDSFMTIFKYYKSNKPQPSLEQVLQSECNDEVSMMPNQNTSEDARASNLGLQNTKTWKMFEFKRHPGLILIRDPFTSSGQKYWIRNCLEEYPRKPNKTNIDIERHIEDWWQECLEGNQCDKKLQKKLRWTTLGYHHNWDTKVYNEENKNAFPSELSELCDVVANRLGYRDFRSEAAIVNYYHMGSTLSAHIDYSECDLEAPLFSFSFGQSAIFLVGGHNKSIKPSAILLNSGDILVMSKETRLCYHAVPKILPASKQPWNEGSTSIIEKGVNFKFVDETELILGMKKNIEDKEWSKFNSYVEESRININVRQVLKQNQKSLLDSNSNT
ncbi:nucleic acid dioxygenase ALKBH1 [Bicyclus anynana]|uniref:Nucleic acid dioxygenase ALKBH1 n=1 Tax=Bicyclus anynana TaxID=110368 RepID=A0A6J1MRK9_BICAN|nr:nucleic acid dioxygenase ALKBH1 [Bicyclus anynana]